MNWKTEWKPLVLIGAAFLASYNLPVGSGRFDGALLEAFHLVKWYAREHVVLCLLPAFFIAGAISVFVNQAAVIKYFGPQAEKATAYGVASVSGTILAVCSCTVLPLFAGIYRMGAGLGPATAFLYSGPAINVLAIILTARVLGIELGVARAVGAVLFAVVVGLLMALLFKKEEKAKTAEMASLPVTEPKRPLWQTAAYIGSMVGVLVFANWSQSQGSAGIWNSIFQVKWIITGGFALLLGAMLGAWYGVRWRHLILVGLVVIVLSYILPGHPQASFVAGIIGLSVVLIRSGGEAGEWLAATWSFAKQILPLLFGGILAAGVFLGRPGEEGLLPSEWISALVGGNSLMANLSAAVVGALMYFATLTEVPILQGLIGSGMGKGPALALLLAGPALSLPNMLVIRSIMGTKKTLTYILLVVVMATLSGLIFGAI